MTVLDPNPLGLIFLRAAGWWPPLQFPVLAAATFIGTVACAAISYYVIERPLMRWGRREFATPSPPESPHPRCRG